MDSAIWICHYKSTIMLSFLASLRVTLWYLENLSGVGLVTCIKHKLSVTRLFGKGR